MYLIFYALLVIVLMAFCPTGLIGLAGRIFKRTPAKPAAPATPAMEKTA
jgi:branched-chain amino acid transport system permease protein